MTREEAIAVFKGFKFLPREMKAVDMAIKALKQEPCGDAISRQAMHIELEKWITYGEYKYSTATQYLYDRIDGLPPVKPAEKAGHWIPVSERLPEDYTDVIATVEEHYKDEIGYFVFPQARYSREYGWEWPYEAGTDYWTGLNGVVAWMPLPEPYKESPTDKEVEE